MEKNNKFYLKILLIVLLIGSTIFLFRNEIFNKIRMQTYKNSRFGYQITYPKNWPSGKEAANGDGRKLYDKPPGVEIAVYGTHMPSPFSIQNDPFTKENFYLNDGTRTTLLRGVQDNKIFYFVYFTENDKQYVFYSKTTKEFFDKNSKVIENVAKSLKLL